MSGRAPSSQAKTPASDEDTQSPRESVARGVGVARHPQPRALTLRRNDPINAGRPPEYESQHVVAQAQYPNREAWGDLRQHLWARRARA